MNRYQGPLKNPLSLVLPDGTTFRLTEAEVCLSVDSGVDVLSVAARVAGDWLARAFLLRAAPILLVGHSVTLASAVMRSWEHSQIAGSEAVRLDLLLKDGDGPALLRRLSEPVRPLPLSADELAALVEATRDDDPAGLIPRLLATVAAERERVGPLGVRLVASTGEKIRIGQALVLTANGLEIALPKIPGVYMDVRPAGTVPPAAVGERIDTIDVIRPRGALV